MAEKKKLLEIQNLKKYFNVKKAGFNKKLTVRAVDDVSMYIYKGETLGLVGESGCGKTTMGRTIIRLYEPTAGAIIYDGKTIYDSEQKIAEKMLPYRRKMQIIFQDPMSSLDPRMAVWDIIEEPLKIQKKLSKNDRYQKVRELMDTVGIAERIQYSYPHELDGGRRQRIGIARALALEPKFIVCDEPVSALDVSIQAQIINLLMDLQKEKKLSYMFITHDLSVVKYISDEIMVMYLGQIVEKAPSDELFSHPVHPYTKALLSAIPIPDAHSRREKIRLKGEITSPINPKPGCRLAPRCQYATDACLSPQTVAEIKPNHFVNCCRATFENSGLL